jgi:hypothetical protein
VLAGNISEAIGDIIPAGKDHPFNLGADCGEGCPGAVAAIEQRQRASVWNRRARRCNEGREPAGTSVNPGIDPTHQDYHPARAGGGFQRPHRLCKRMDNDNWIGIAPLQLFFGCYCSCSSRRSRLFAHF